jgi:hypothetical protein
MEELTVQDLLSSDMMRGFVADSSKIIREWYEYIYIAKVKSVEGVYKIGKTNSLKRRDLELASEVTKIEPASIIYAWNVPRPLAIETLVKGILRTNLWREAPENTPGASEMFKIPLYAMVLVVRLSLLCVFVEKGYINENVTMLRRRLQPYIQGLRFNQIRYKKELYPSRVPSIRNQPYSLGTYVIVDFPLDAYNKGTEGEAYNGKSYTGIIVKVGEDYYMVDWESTNEMAFLTNSKAPFTWTRSIDSGQRILDIESVCSKFNIPGIVYSEMYSVGDIIQIKRGGVWKDAKVTRVDENGITVEFVEEEGDDFKEKTVEVGEAASILRPKGGSNLKF